MRDSSFAPIAGVIYDCDGTLVDSERLNARCMADMLAHDHGIVLDPAGIEREFRGRRFADLCAILAARHRLDLAGDFSARYRTHAETLFTTELQAMPGVQAAIEAIDHPRCVASSAPPDRLATALQVTGLSGYFGDRVFSAYTIDAWKPAPDLFLHAAAALGLPPPACAVIEDSDVGVEAARRAGIRVFGYDRAHTIGKHRGAALTRFTDYAELPALIAAG